MLETIEGADGLSINDISEMEGVWTSSEVGEIDADDSVLGVGAVIDVA
jgi:hypothetical protein